MSFRISDLMMNVAPAIPLAMSCGGYTGPQDPKEPPKPPSPPPPPNPSEDFYPTEREALDSLRGQLRQKLWMQVN